MKISSWYIYQNVCLAMIWQTLMAMLVGVRMNYSIVSEKCAKIAQITRINPRSSKLLFISKSFLQHCTFSTASSCISMTILNFEIGLQAAAPTADEIWQQHAFQTIWVLKLKRLLTKSGVCFKRKLASLIQSTWRVIRGLFVSEELF